MNIRKFHGNQFSREKKKKEKPIPHKKVKTVKKVSAKKTIEGFRLFDMCTFSFPKCVQCCLSIDEDYNKRKGLACQIIVKCDSCDYVKKTIPHKQLAIVKLKV